MNNFKIHCGENKRMDEFSLCASSQIKRNSSIGVSVNFRGVTPNNYNLQSRKSENKSIKTAENSPKGRSHGINLAAFVHDNQLPACSNGPVFGTAQCINLEQQQYSENHYIPPAHLPFGSVSKIAKHLPLFEETFVNLHSSLPACNSCASMDNFEVSDGPVTSEDLLLRSGLPEPCDLNSCEDLSLLPEESVHLLEDITLAQESYPASDEVDGFSDLSASLDQAMDVNEVLELIDLSLPPFQSSSDFPLETLLSFDMEDMKETELGLESFTDFVSCFFLRGITKQ
uniref:Uncharacterized protein n=2 Tax=Schistocephalus solidus TaxID=70667 RepID=A0A0X3PKC3_SCHSO